MTFRDSGLDGTTRSDHHEHDPELIAAHAAGDLPTVDVATADGLVRDCIDCARLHEELIAIAIATRALPAPRAPRAFTLTEEQADRLGRGAWLRRLARPLVGRGGVGRPLATAFTTLGLVGLLLASVPGGLTPVAQFAAERDVFEVAGPAASDAGGYVPTDASDGSGRGSEVTGDGAPVGSGDPKSGPETSPEPTSDGPWAPQLALVALSSGFLAGGLGLFAVRRRFGRRLG